VAEEYGSRKPRGRGGRRVLTTFIVLLIVIVAGLAVLDRVGATYAERVISDRVAEQVASQKATSAKPDVTVEGVPFLTQVAKGRYQEIKIELADFSAPAGNNKTIKLPLLDIRAKDVRAPLDTLRTRQGDIVATTVTGSGTIDYPQVAQLIGQKNLKLTERDGKLIGSAPVTALGQTFTVTGTASLAVKNGVVQVRFADVTAQGLPNVPLVRNIIGAYANQLALDLKPPQLPLKLAIQKVEPRPNGLAVTLGATDVSLNASGL
jgi:hypothetical protein